MEIWSRRWSVNDSGWPEDATGGETSAGRHVRKGERREGRTAFGIEKEE